MPRVRNIHPGFFTNDTLQGAEAASGLPLRMAFIGLACHADRVGRFAWQPTRLKLGILPYDAVDFGAVLEALEAAQFIVKYEVDGRAYGLIPTFLRYQKPHPREAPSTIPPPPTEQDLGVVPTKPRHVQGKAKALPRQRKGVVEPGGLSGLRAFRPSGSQALGVEAVAAAAAEPDWLTQLTPPAQTLIRGQLRSRTAERAFALACDLATLFPDQDPGNQHHTTDEISEGVVACISLERPLTGKTVRNLIQAARRDVGRPLPAGEEDEFTALARKLRAEEAATLEAPSP